MAGLETILEKIHSDAEARCTAILDVANKFADTVREDARVEGAAAAKAIAETAEQQQQSILQKAQSAAQAAKSRALLKEKVDIIREVIDEAVKALRAMPDADYAEALVALAAKNARPGEGVMRLSPSDLPRLTDGFTAKMNAALPAGAVLRVEPAASDLGGGCILVYGDIELNCTFAALTEAKSDELRDEVNRRLFG